MGDLPMYYDISGPNSEDDSDGSADRSDFDKMAQRSQSLRSLDAGRVIIQRMREAFAAMPPDRTALKQPARVAGKMMPSWLELLEQVLLEGPPSNDDGLRFSSEVYGLCADLQAGTNQRVYSVCTEGTFAGAYPPPDDLDGQTIDLVAVNCVRGAATVKVEAAPLPICDELATYTEIHQQQSERNDYTAINSVGLLPTASSSTTSLWVEEDVDGRVVRVQKSSWQKLALSDHVPITFSIAIQEPSGRRHRFLALSFNMLAMANMPFSYWNTPPQGDPAVRELWRMASRVRAAADRKTKWLPQEWATMSRLNLSDEQLRAHPTSPETDWEIANRQLWKWIQLIQAEQFMLQLDANPLAHDQVRMSLLAQLLLRSESSAQPDVLFLQEVGLIKIDPQLIRGQTEPAVLSDIMSAAYPGLRELLSTAYSVINISPKLNMRRGGTPEMKDTGVMLMKRSLLEKYDVQVITKATDESNEALQQLYADNAGKPIVGVQVRDKEGRNLVNLFGAHFDKGKTRRNLVQLFELIEQDEGTGDAPTVVTGDFNAVLLPNEPHPMQAALDQDLIRVDGARDRAAAL